MAADVDFVVEDQGQLPAAELLAVLADGYGHAFSADWFEWKHRRGPWGPSRAVVARDDGGLLGVVFGLPWRFHADGHEHDGIRLVDGATTPRAVRRGVFRRIVQELLEPTDGSRRPEIVIATATPEAQGAHVKNGAVALDPIAYSYRPTAWSGATLVSGDEVTAGFRPGWRDPLVSTPWTSAALRWRIGPAIGATYSVEQLANSDSVNGLVHRIVSRRGLRVLVVATLWGSAADRRRLVRAAARRARAVAVLAPTGPGTPTAMPRPAVRRGQSLLCVWDHRHPPANRTDIGTRERWSLDGLDLEGVI